MNCVKDQKDMTPKDESPRSEGVQCDTGEEWRITNSPRMNEASGPKQKQYPVVDVSGEKRKIRCCKQCYCIGTMNQGKLDMAKQEMVRINIYIFKNQ